jgi:hypothetical protein
VESYDRLVGWLRPFYNVWAAMTQRPCLPRVGQPLRCLMGAIPMALHDDPVIFEALVKASLGSSFQGQADYLLIGQHETDPLLPVVQRLATESYVTRMYLVSWEDGRSFRAQLDGRPSYLELGFL